MRSTPVKRCLIVAFCLGFCAIGCEQLGIRIGKPNLPKPDPVDQGIFLNNNGPDKSNSPDSRSPLEQTPRSNLAHRPVLPYTEWTLAETAADSLARIGKPSVSELIKALDDSNPLLRQRAAMILASIGPEAKDAVPALVIRLGDVRESVRKAAARAIGQIGADAHLAVPDLMRIIEQDTKDQAGLN